ncbi:MAG: TRAP transporter small permease subunit [Betaproteobacteria bacterium]|nr:TRAP transporter small permease subunit [Betaproteobacteria bacterium]
MKQPFIRKASAWLRRRAENIAAGLLAVMFVAFIVQIVFRYFFNFPIGWTSELSVITWLWLVLWGAAFVVKESEEIRLDLIYGAAGRHTRRVMGIITGVSIVALYAASLPATVKYVSFMKVESTSYLKIRFDWLFSIYVFFIVAVIVRYLWILSHLLRGKDPEPLDLTKASSGL